MKRSHENKRTPYGRILLLIAALALVAILVLYLVSAYALYRHMVPAGATTGEELSPSEREIHVRSGALGSEETIHFTWAFGVNRNTTAILSDTAIILYRPEDPDFGGIFKENYADIDTAKYEEVWFLPLYSEPYLRIEYDDSFARVTLTRNAETNARIVKWVDAQVAPARQQAPTQRPAKAGRGSE
jgi:hypothetical protein